MINRRQFLQNTTLALSGFALSGCGWRLADVKSCSLKNMDKLFIYTWAGYTDKDLLEQFHKETKVQAIADVYDSNEAMLARIQASGCSGYSIIYPSDYTVQDMVKQDLLMELDKTRIEGLENLFEKFRSPTYDPDNRYSLPISWGTTGLIYNTKVLTKPPTDWDYLWENADKLKQRMSLLNDTREVFGATLRMLGYSYNSTSETEIKKAYEKLLKLKPAIATFTSDAWRTQILNGDLMIAMCYSSDANEIMDENEDLAYVVPQSGSSIWTDTLVIPRTAPNVTAAYHWLSFMLRPQVAASITERLSFATPNKPGFDLLPKEIQENTSLFPSEEMLARCESMQPVSPDVAEIYDKYWTKLTSG